MKRVSFTKFVHSMQSSYSSMFEPNEKYTADFIDHCNTFCSDMLGDMEFPKDSQNYDELKSYLTSNNAQSQCMQAFEELWSKYQEYLDTGDIPVRPEYKHTNVYQSANDYLKRLVQ